jgi:hypothetical protein
MYTAVQPKLKSALDGFQPATCCTLATTTTAAGGAARQQHKAAMSAAHVAAGLELCRLSKLLLVAGEEDLGAAGRLQVGQGEASVRSALR